MEEKYSTDNRATLKRTLGVLKLDGGSKVRMKHPVGRSLKKSFSLLEGSLGEVSQKEGLCGGRWWERIKKERIENVLCWGCWHSAAERTLTAEILLLYENWSLFNRYIAASSRHLGRPYKDVELL